MTTRNHYWDVRNAPSAGEIKRICRTDPCRVVTRGTHQPDRQGSANVADSVSLA